MDKIVKLVIVPEDTLCSQRVIALTEDGKAYVLSHETARHWLPITEQTEEEELPQ